MTADIKTDRLHCPVCGADLQTKPPTYVEKVGRFLKLHISETDVHASGGEFELDETSTFEEVTCSVCGAHLEDHLGIHSDDDVTWD